MHIKDILKKLIIVMSIFAISVSFSIVKVEASTTTTIVEPTEDQYLELRATTITDVAGQNKQVLFELWGYNIDFKRI